MNGKGKFNINTESPSDKPMSPLSLEALLSDPSVYEVTLIEEPTNGRFSSLGDLFGEEVVQEAREMIRDDNPFKIVAAVRICS